MKYLLLAAALVLSACTKVETVYKTNTAYLAAPEFFLQDCKFPPPPDKVIYLKATALEKQKLLVDTYLNAASLNSQCNARLNRAREYRKNMLRLYKHEAQDVIKITH